jgi:hypothetical protein
MKFKYEREHSRKLRAAARAEARKIKKETRTAEWKKGGPNG